MKQYEIMKKMIADGVQVFPGDIVDVSGWKHVESLESMRYIRRVSETKPAVEAKPKAVKKTATKTEE